MLIFYGKQFTTALKRSLFLSGFKSRMIRKYNKRYSFEQSARQVIRLGLICFYIFCSVTLRAQKNIDSASKFIQQHQHFAVEQMNVYGIPASVTLAQAIYESGSGGSYLCRKGNNFFGIKCHREWGGDSLLKDDEERNECFRAYTSIEQCYEDRVLFLNSRSRYHFLFQLPLNDYKRWCLGLQEAGYATNKNYATTLIYIIEKYKLFTFEMPEPLASKPIPALATHLNESLTLQTQLSQTLVSASVTEPPANTIVKAIIQKHYHIASKGQTPNDVSTLYGIDIRLICSNNSISPKTVFSEGEVVFLTKKKPYKYELPVNQ